MTSEWAPLLLRAALFSSLAVLVLLAARTLLRRWFGASLAYLAWLIVPVVTLAALLPGRAAPLRVPLPVLPRVQALTAQAAPAAAPQQFDALLFAWACGAAAIGLWFVLNHRTFLRGMGKLSPQGKANVYLSDTGAGPASVGLFRPRIVVPHDFALRYSPDEQALVIAHEQVHIARRDVLANLLAAVFQCVFWFNPLVHLGVRRLRQDQELACDAVVMARHPRQRRTYAEALLKSHTGAFLPGAGIHCHWQNPHPTKERVMSLQQTPPGTLRRLAGRCLLALLALGAAGATLGVRAEQAAVAPMYSVALNVDAGDSLPESFQLFADAMSMDATGTPQTPRVLARAGDTFSVASEGWRVDMSVRPGGAPHEVWVAGKLFKDGKLVTSPTLLAHLGEQASIRVGDSERTFTLVMVVSPQP